MEPLLQYSLHHVEPQLLEMLANPEFFGGEGEEERLGFHYTCGAQLGCATYRG